MMRSVLLSACVAAVGLFASFERHAAASDLTCPMQKARVVSFRDATAQDVLEVSIGTGPCERATLTIVIRSDLGHILYSYVAPFKQHIVTNWQDPSLDKDAFEFVDEIVAKGLSASSDLPPYLEPDAYYDEHYGYIKLRRRCTSSCV